MFYFDKSYNIIIYQFMYHQTILTAVVKAVRWNDTNKLSSNKYNAYQAGRGNV